MFGLRMCLLIIALVASGAEICSAAGNCGPGSGPPKYLLLQSSNLGQGMPTPGRTYSYGWFGVCPTRPDRIYHRAYYNSYWEYEVRRGP